MQFNDLLNVAETVAIVAGIAVALVQLRQFRLSRQREAALEMLRSFQTVPFVRGLRAIFAMPDGLSAEAFEQVAGERLDDIFCVFTTMESLGILVCRGEVDLDLVDDFFSGAVVLTYVRSRAYLEDLRASSGRETIGEWVQWLAERMMERESAAPPVPAHVAHRDWKPPGR